MFKFKNNNQIEEKNKLDKIIENQETLKNQLNEIIELIKNKNKIEDNQLNIEEDDYEDPLLEIVIESVLKEQKVSTSLIQRNFRIGYARAGRIIDKLEKLGMISGYKGSKPREVLLSIEEWNNRKDEFLDKINRNY